MPYVTVNEIKEITGAELIGGNGNLVIGTYSTDSRKVAPDTLFIPIVGERADAHDYILSAYENGLRATFYERKEVPADFPADLAVLKVENNVKALQTLGMVIRERFSMPIIGITGSVGKTTTKEMVAAALSEGKRVLKTDGNMNSQVSLPQMMMRIEPEHEIGVIEMGMSRFHEMEKIVPVSKPETVIMTNIGVSHIGNLHSKENILKEKLRITDFMKPGGLLLVNGDDTLLSQLKTGYTGDLYEETKKILPTLNVKTYGTGENADYRAENIVLSSENAEFTVGGRKVVLNAGGIHNVLNALCAIGAADFYGVDFDTAVAGLAKYRPAKMRGELKNIGGIILMDDTYNASPDSVKASLDIFSAVEAKRHMAILADILELGDISAELHSNIGKSLKGYGITQLIAVGDAAEHICSNAEVAEKYYVKTKEEALSLAETLLEPGDAVLIKGSRGMQLEYVVAGLSKKFADS